MKNFLKRFEEWSLNESSMGDESMMNANSNMEMDLDDDMIINIFRDALDYGLPYILDDEGGIELMYNKDEYSQAVKDIRATYGDMKINYADIYIKILENGGTLTIGEYYQDVYGEDAIDSGYRKYTITMEDVLRSVRRMPKKLLMELMDGTNDDKAYIKMLETVFYGVGK